MYRYIQYMFVLNQNNEWQNNCIVSVVDIKQPQNARKLGRGQRLGFPGHWGRGVKLFFPTHEISRMRT